jgi:hypothetical protein
MHEVRDELLFADRVAGLDIAKAMVEVTIRVASAATQGRRRQESRTFVTIRAELEALAAWLESWGVTKAGMEANPHEPGLPLHVADVQVEDQHAATPSPTVVIE